MNFIINCQKFLLIIAICCLIASSFAATRAGKSPMQTLDRSSVPDNVIFYDDKENKYSLDQFEGQTILLVFWATWCAPCVREMPDLDILQKDFRKLPFKIIPISQDSQGVKVIQEHFESYQIRYLPIYYDYKNQLFKAFEIVGLPTSILIDPDGRKLVSFTGNVNWYDEEIRAVILSHIPGNHPEPKNSYRAPSLNQPAKPLKPIQTEDKKEAIKSESLEKEVEEEEIPESDDKKLDKGIKDEKNSKSLE